MADFAGRHHGPHEVESYPAPLNAFRTVARLQSFTQAASALHVSQSALTMQIGALEAQLNAQLFDRSRRRICLTFIGENLLAIAERIVQQAEEFSSLAEELAGLDRGVVRIASLPSIASRYLVPAAKLLKVEFPGFRLQIADAVAERVIALVKSGEVDFGITSPTLDDSELACEFLLEDWLCAYERASPTDASSPSSIALEALAGKRLILPGRNGIVRKLFDRAIAQSGLAVESRQRGGTWWAATAMKASAAMRATRSRLSCVTPAVCGLAITAGWPSRGCSFGDGSRSQTSRPAPPRWPDCSAARSADSS